MRAFLNGKDVFSLLLTKSWIYQLAPLFELSWPGKDGDRRTV